MVRTEIVTHADLVKQVVAKLNFNVQKAIDEAEAWANQFSDAVLQHLAESSDVEVIRVYREMRRSQVDAEKDPEVIAAKQRIADAQAARVWLALFHRHPELVDCQANRQAIFDYALSLTDDGVVQPRHLEEAAVKLPHLARQKVPAAADRKQQQLQDAETFQQAARQLDFSINTANEKLVNEALGFGYSVADIAQAISEQRLRLARASQEEIEHWRDEATEARNEWLIDDSIDLEQRKAVAKQILTDSRNQAVEEQSQRELESARMRHNRGRFDGSPYPQLPPEIDRKAIFAADSKTLRGWIDRFGDYQISARVRGIQ